MPRGVGYGCFCDYALVCDHHKGRRRHRYSRHEHHKKHVLHAIAEGKSIKPHSAKNREVGKLKSISSKISSLVNSKTGSAVTKGLIAATGKVETIGSLPMALLDSNPPRTSTWSFMWVKVAKTLIIQVPDFAVSGTTASWSIGGSSFSKELACGLQALPKDKKVRLGFFSNPPSELSDGSMTVVVVGSEPGLSVKAQNFVCSAK